MSTTLKDGVMHYSQFSLHLSLFINFSNFEFFYIHFVTSADAKLRFLELVFELTGILINTYSVSILCFLAA